MNLPPTTPSTKRARRDAKRLIAAIRNGRISIHHGFRVWTTEGDSLTYLSEPFPSLEAAFVHIVCRAAHTGHDLARFTAIATRYFRRFGFPRSTKPTAREIAQYRAEEEEEMDDPRFDHYAAI